MENNWEKEVIMDRTYNEKQCIDSKNCEGKIKIKAGIYSIYR